MRRLAEDQAVMVGIDVQVAEGGKVPLRGAAADAGRVACDPTEETGSSGAQLLRDPGRLGGTWSAVWLPYAKAP